MHGIYKIKENTKLLIIFFLVVISRLPFIWNSPGIDWDTWIVLQTGQEISETGIYKASRLPGYPLSEYLASIFGTNSWLYLNFFTVFFTATGMCFFYGFLKHFHIRNKVFTTLTFAFVQGIFIASTTNMEYLWSICFLFSALYFLCKKQTVPAGFFLGLMIVSRFTSIVFLPAIIFFLFVVLEEKNIVHYLKTFAIAIFTVGIGFSTVFKTYGFNIFPPGEYQFIGLKSLISLYTLYIYGLLGVIALLIFFFYLLKNWKKIQLSQKKKHIIKFCIIMIGFTTLLYLRFPYESYYNLPLIPFLIISMNLLIGKQKARYLIFGLLIISPFLFHLNKNKFNFKGSVFANENIENSVLRYTDKLHSNFSCIKQEKKLLVAGGFYYIFLYKYPNDNPNIKIYKRPTLELLEYYVSEGYKIYYPDSVVADVEYFQHYNLEEIGQSLMPDIKIER